MHTHTINEETQFNDDIQIAILEAMEDFQKAIDGFPVLTDELLAQVVGEALALRLSQTSSLYGKECVSNVLAVYICLQELTSGCSVIAIIAIKYYAKILHLSITDSYLRQFKTLGPEEPRKNLDSFLPIDSTAWFDLSEQSGRKSYVRHMVALRDQADDAQAAEADYVYSD